MKKVVGKSLVLGAIALGVLSLLGGPNLFSVLSNIKFPSKPQTEKPVEKEAVIEEKQEKEVAVTELALEVAKPAEEPVAEERVVQKQESVVKPEQLLERIEPKQESKQRRQIQERRAEPTKPIEKPAVTSSSGYSRRYLEDGVVEITKPNGEAIRYDKNGVRIWSSRHGRLIETKEEKAWRRDYARQKKEGSSGSKGKGVWCLTPRDIRNVDDRKECSSMLGWGSY